MSRSAHRRRPELARAAMAAAQQQVPEGNVVAGETIPRTVAGWIVREHDAGRMSRRAVLAQCRAAAKRAAHAVAVEAADTQP